MRTIPTIRQKALKINLANKFYGTFSEIGAGQEVARHFFKSGAASGSIAKTMSAYDMTFSDSIYGKEKSGRYVCHSRLRKMLSREYDLLTERLGKTIGKEKQFFSYANTFTTINFTKTSKGHGWMGVRFQLAPGGETCEVHLHLKLKDPSSDLQQDAIGVIGVNLIHACFFYDDRFEFIDSLVDNIDSSRIEVDFIHFDGDKFKDFDNRLLNLQLLKNNLTESILFNANGEIELPSDEFYKKNILVVRGSFRPPTNVSMDMIETGEKNFKKQCDGEIITVCEMTMNTLREDGDITDEDFLARVDMLNALDKTVLVTNYPQYYKLTNFFSQFRFKSLGLVLGIYNFQQVFDDEYGELDGGIVSSLGQLFRRNVYLYIYPYQSKEGEIESISSLKIDDQLNHLFLHFIENGQIIDLKDYDKKYLHIFSRMVLKEIKEKKSGWEKSVPKLVAKTIKEKCLFGYPCDLE